MRFALVCCLQCKDHAAKIRCLKLIHVIEIWYGIQFIAIAIAAPRDYFLQTIICILIYEKMNSTTYKQDEPAPKVVPG